LARGTGRAGSVEADRDHVLKSDPRFFRSDPETICNLLKTDLWALLGERGMLTQALDEEFFLVVQ